MYYTYVLLLKNNRYYYGYTNNIENRVEQHVKGSVKSTQGLVIKLLYVREFTSKVEATTFERYLKKVRNKNFVDKLFKNHGEVAKLVKAPV